MFYYKNFLFIFFVGILVSFIVYIGTRLIFLKYNFHDYTFPLSTNIFGDFTSWIMKSKLLYSHLELSISDSKLNFFLIALKLSQKNLLCISSQFGSLPQASVTYYISDTMLVDRDKQMSGTFLSLGNLLPSGGKKMHE